LKIKESFGRLKTFVGKKLFKSVIDIERSTAFKEASSLRVREDSNWRRITETSRLRDLTPLKHDKMIKVVDWLVERNPQARRIIKLWTDFTYADGISIKFKDEKAQEIIDKFMLINEWEERGGQRFEDLSRYGELIFRPFVNEFNGIVKLGAFDPEQIDKITRNEENAEELEYLYPKSSETSHGPNTKKYEIIKRNYKEDKISGEIFTFQINKSSFGTRGQSDLLNIADWLDIYDKTLFTMSERVVFLLSFLWDITIEGANEQDIAGRAMELLINPPKAGSSVIHNEKEKWDAMNPKLTADDLVDFMKMIGTQLTSGSGFPSHWIFGVGDDINRATSKEITEPTIRQIKRRQKFIRDMFILLVEYQIQEAINADQLTGKVADYPFKITLADPSKKDVELVADSISKLTPALSQSVMDEFLSNETAQRVMALMINQLGVETNAEEEDKKIDDEQPIKESKHAYNALQDIYKKIKCSLDKTKRHNKQKKKWADNNPEKRKAHNALTNAIRDGKIKRGKCHSCGSQNAQAHHNDYSRPFDVVWECSKCHGKRRKGNGKES